VMSLIMSGSVSPFPSVQSSVIVVGDGSFDSHPYD
jgi:hypothetical protein